MEVDQTLAHAGIPPNELSITQRQALAASLSDPETFFTAAMQQLAPVPHDLIPDNIVSTRPREGQLHDPDYMADRFESYRRESGWLFHDNNNHLIDAGIQFTEL